MERRCYWAKEPPKVEIRDGVAFIKPAGSHCEIATTPHTLGLFVALARRSLEAFHSETRCSVIEFPPGAH